LIASAHVAAGAVAGLVASRLTDHRLGRIILAFVLGVVSHVVLDGIPHSDYAPLSSPLRLWIAFGETLVTLALVALITLRRRAPNAAEYLLSGIAGSILPDAKSIVALFVTPALTERVATYGNRFHALFHAPAPESPVVGLTVEVACTLSLLALLVVIGRPRR
jgi:hypothetical protein